MAPCQSATAAGSRYSAPALTEGAAAKTGERRTSKTAGGSEAERPAASESTVMEMALHHPPRLQTRRQSLDGGPS